MCVAVILITEEDNELRAGWGIRSRRRPWEKIKITKTGFSKI
jgi:hypothetical protein